MNLALYLSLLTAGILFLVAGLYVTRMTWRADIEPFGRRSRMFLIAMHPEQFAKPDRLSQIRILNMVGGFLILGALIVVGYDISAVMART